MGVFEYSKVAAYLSPEYRTAVETGTCLGYSTQRLKGYFNEVHTIELDEKLHQQAVTQFSKDPNVICHQGDSKEVLKALISKISGPTLFFLDAHWSGDDSTDWESSQWKGYGSETSYCGDEPTAENQVPLLEEMRLICEQFKSECVIYIDDADKFGADGKGLKDKGFKGEDWSHLSMCDLKKVVFDRMMEFKHIGAQLVIKLSEMKPDVTE
jgi:hypothetical protein